MNLQQLRTRLHVTAAGFAALGSIAFLGSTQTKVDPEPISPGDTPAQMVNRPEASTSALYSDVSKLLLGASAGLSAAGVATCGVKEPNDCTHTNRPTPPPPGGFGLGD